MKFLTDQWDKFWFRSEPGIPTWALRAIIYGLGSIYVFYISWDVSDAPYGQWQPLSFYQLLNGPISPQLLEAIHWLWLVSALIAATGWRFLFFSSLCFVSAVFYFGYSYNFGTVYHATHIYVMALGIMMFSSTSQDRATQWPQQLLKLYIVYVFFLCGMQKLYYGGGLDWALSESFYLRLLTNPWQRPLTEVILQSPLWVSQVLAFLALVVVELGSPLALMHRLAGMTYIFIWTSLHVFVVLSYGGHRMFFSQVFCYMVFFWMPRWLKPTAEVRAQSV